MNHSIIKEIKSDQKEFYKQFLGHGLIHDEENFRISPNDDLHLEFPTKDKEDSFTLGAYIDNTLAGIVSFERDGFNREKLRHKGTLFRMYVSYEFRGQGISKELIDALLVRVRMIVDIEQINLTVISNNDKAKGLYEKFGFKTFSSEEHAIKWKGKYFTEDQMVLRLK
ncbi:GNAT family N-acetyltransferase [Sporocytophaga myxococcoides]|uniref:GNAT family N-acetyltransferase n=1 Tax=Sporocytophaga myxococcoides TaxID=153721 RepID=UPI00041DD30C|nr:GNAT family N-acetyltransferase [Sporocytophaga myxococcoides]